MNLYEAQWLAYALPYRRFAAALTDCNARLGADVDCYSLIVSDLHRLLVAGLPAHCETFCTSSLRFRDRDHRAHLTARLRCGGYIDYGNSSSSEYGRVGRAGLDYVL